MRCARVAAVILATGCGFDDRGGDEVTNGPGPYDSPLDFDRRSCRLNAMQGLDPQGVYHFRIDYGDGVVRAASGRIDADSNGLATGIFLGEPATDVRASDHELFFHNDLDASPDNMASRTLLLCDRDGDDLLGLWAYCTSEDCTLATVLARKVERMREAEAFGLTEVGSFDTDDDAVSLNVRVADNLAFLVRGTAGMQVIDVADPREPRLRIDVKPSFSDTEYYNDVKVIHHDGTRYALVASNQRGMVVYKAVTPTFLADEGSFGLQGNAGLSRVHTLAVDETNRIAYLANRDLGLEVWDIGALPQARLLDDFFPANAPDGAFLHDLYVEGTRAYLNFWNAGMVVVDISRPDDVREIGRFAGYGGNSSHSSWVTTVDGQRIAAHGDEEWGSHLRLVDVSEGGGGPFAEQVGEWQTRPEVSAHNVMASGSEVIMSYYQDGIRILDISDPTTPRQTAWFNTWPGYAPTTGYNFFEGAIGLDVDPLRGLIYVADAHRDLVILQR